MRIGALLALSYLGVSLFVTTIGGALTNVISAVLLALAVTWVTGYRHFHEAFGWFRAHRLAGLLVGVAVISTALVPLLGPPLLLRRPGLSLTDLPLWVLVVAPISFLWFWLFAAVGVRLQARRDRKIVEDALMRRHTADGVRPGDPSAG